MKNLAQVTETNLVQWKDNQDWLGSQDGVDSCRTVSLDGAACRAIFTDGIVPSGTPIGEQTAGGLWAPGDPATGLHGGHLLFAVNVGTAAPPSPAVDKFGCAVYEDGRVIVANLPGAPSPAFTKALRPQIIYV